MTAAETNLAVQLLREIDTNLNLLRLDLSELGATMTRCVAILDHINRESKLADAPL